MKAEFTEKGYLVIIAEDNIEAYALNHWVKENIPPYEEACPKFRYPNLAFDCSCISKNKDAQ